MGELINLIQTLKFNLSELDSVLNIDRALWALAVNTATLNLDTYNGYYIHNYYLYQTEDGLFQMIPWDLSESFVGAILGWDFGALNKFIIMTHMDLNFPQEKDHFWITF